MLVCPSATFFDFKVQFALDIGQVLEDLLHLLEQVICHSNLVVLLLYVLTNIISETCGGICLAVKGLNG